MLILTQELNEENQEFKVYEQNVYITNLRKKYIIEFATYSTQLVN